MRQRQPALTVCQHVQHKLDGFWERQITRELTRRARQAEYVRRQRIGHAKKYCIERERRA